MSASYRDAVRAALLYLLISVVWMQLSGYLLSSLFDNSAERLALATDQRLCLGDVERRLDLHCPGAVVALPGRRRDIARTK